MQGKSRGKGKLDEILEDLSKTYQLPIRLGLLSSAEVAKGPSGIAKHAELVVLTQKSKERPQSTLLEHKVSALRTVSSNVAQSPDGLFADIHDRRGKQVDEFWDSA